MATFTVVADCVAVPRCTTTPLVNSTKYHRRVTDAPEVFRTNRSVVGLRILPRTWAVLEALELT